MSENKPSNQIIYGRNPVMDTLNSIQHIERVYLRANITGDWEKEVRQICKERDIPLKKVPPIKLDKLTRNKNHQGIAAITSLIRYQEIDDVIPLIFEQGQTPLCVLLDNVTDVRNIGAIARSVEAMGAHALIISGKNAGMINEDSIKASAGAIMKVNVCREKNTLEALRKLQAHGIMSVATILESEKNIYDLDLLSPLCIVMGSEGDGLHRSIYEACDHIGRIPQVGTSDSLNVSVAASICMYEIVRQRS
ncbi:MAG: 23S rRNA (guanosine2251-2'-O)-methyltransferase [Saprospiraceae bacterium]